MTDYSELLKSLEEATKGMQDPELKRIAFQELLRNALHPGEQQRDGRQPKRSPSVGKPARRSRAQSKTNRSAAGPREAVIKLDISPDEKGLPRWDSLGQDWKKFCWILEAARLKGVDGLKNSEISYLINRVFREDFRPALVNNLKKKIKASIVKFAKLDAGGGKSVEGWKILSGGTQELGKNTETEKKV